MEPTTTGCCCIPFSFLNSVDRTVHGAAAAAAAAAGRRLPDWDVYSTWEGSLMEGKTEHHNN
jgi:hypothetical protein